MTFSLLPDCLAARLGGTLQSIEDAVAAAETAPSLARAADAVRSDAVHLPGAMRWLECRVRAVHRLLTTVRGLYPDRFLQCPAQVGAFRERLKSQAVLVGLRAQCAFHAVPGAAPTHSRRRTWLAASAITASAIGSSAVMDEDNASRGPGPPFAAPARARAPRRPWKRSAAMSLLSPPDSHSPRQPS